MPLWLAVVLAVVAVLLVAGVVAYLLDMLNHTPEAIASSPTTRSSH